ncbi:MAG: 3'(2'),5'-bisphosphate nucleotidase CysQ [Bacteroidota bacterium]
MKAAIKAGKAIMEVYNSSYEIEYKEDKSPLTEADKKANDIINSYLWPTKIPVISEENKQAEFSERAHWNTCWIVDPLDGTKEFIKRNGEFTVNIALASNGQPQLGVIYVPVARTVYYAEVDAQKAFKSILDDTDETIDGILKHKLSLIPKSTSGSLRVVGSRSHMNEDTTKFVEDLKKDNNDIEIVSRGSSLKFCLVAEGKADIYPRFAPTMEWDTAAGQAICNAVGINVLSLEDNQPLRYNKPNLLNPFFKVSK